MGKLETALDASRILGCMGGMATTAKDYKVRVRAVQESQQY